MTRWRSAVPGGSWRLPEVPASGWRFREVLGGSTSSRLAAPSPSLFFFFAPQPVLCLYNHGDLVEERTLGHLFSFFFPPNPSYAFITTETRWRSAVPGGSWRLPEVPGIGWSHLGLDGGDRGGIEPSASTIATTWAWMVAIVGLLSQVHPRSPRLELRW